MWMLPKHPGLFVWLHLCDWLTVVAALGFAKKKYVLRSVKEKTWTRELEGLKHPKWELHEVLGCDNWPTITYLSTFYLTLLTLEAQFFGSWESMQISHETLVTFTLWSLAQASKNSSLPRFWTLLWRTPEDGGSSRRLLKKLKWLSDWKSFSTSFPNCVSLSLSRESLFTNLTNPTTFKRKMLIWTVQSSDPWGFQTFHRWLQPTERAM